MAMNSRLIERARELQRTGRYADARAVLDTVLTVDPDNEAAWQLRLEVSETADDREYVLRAQLRLHPENHELWEQIVALKTPGTPVRSRPHHYRRLYLATAALVVIAAAVALYFVSHNPLQKDVDRLTAYNRDLTNAYTQLDRAHQSLTSKYQALQKTQAQLQNDLSNLQTHYAELNEQYSKLTADYQILQQQHNQVVADYQGLQQTYGQLLAYSDELNASFTHYRSTAIAPPYIYIQGRMITLTFTLSNGAVHSWLVDFQGLENDIKRGAEMRGQLELFAPTLSLVNAAQKETHAPDFRRFVDPQPFRKVMRNLYDEVNGNESALLYETWHVAGQLTQYVSDELDVETPRFPFETLLAGGGDCEDTSILLASLLKAAPVNWRVYLVYVDSDHPYSAETFNHVLIHVRTSTRDYFIETTNKKDMEYWGDWVDGREVEIQ